MMGCPRLRAFTRGFAFTLVSACSASESGSPRAVVGEAPVDASVPADTPDATTEQPRDAGPPPSPTDGIANGDETDVDCGGTVAPRCAATKKCSAASDCVSGACPDGTCSEAPSCAQKNGGATCGAGEVGSPSATHEDCCASAVVPRAAADGRPFRMDK